jgi:hypothetical protein
MSGPGSLSVRNEVTVVEWVVPTVVNPRHQSLVVRHYLRIMISKRFSIIYLSIAPVLFLLSWYISYRIQDHFMSGTKGITQQQAHINPILYASIFTGIYLAAYLVIRDIYKPTKHQ